MYPRNTEPGDYLIQNLPLSKCTRTITSHSQELVLTYIHIIFNISCLISFTQVRVQARVLKKVTDSYVVAVGRRPVAYGNETLFQIASLKCTYKSCL